MSLVTGAARRGRRPVEFAPQLGLVVIILLLGGDLYAFASPASSRHSTVRDGRSLAVDVVIGFSQMAA